MKKHRRITHAVAAVGLMTVLCTGCGRTNDIAVESVTTEYVEESNLEATDLSEGALTDAVNETANDATDNDATEDQTEGEDKPLPSVVEICESLSNNEMEWYTLTTPYSQSGWCEIDGKDYYFEHTYPSNDWTVEEVAQHFRDNQSQWGRDPRKTWGEDISLFYLWTPDYSQKFVANTDANWLYIDDIPTTPLDFTAHSMNPKDLVTAFQSGEWDGQEKWRSEDFCTNVSVVPEYGILNYNFDTVSVNKSSEHSELLYSGFTETPWWEDETTPFSATIMDAAYQSSLYHDLTVPNTYGYSTSGVHRSSIAAWALAYVDVPWDLQNTLLAVKYGNETFKKVTTHQYAAHTYRAQRNSDGLYALTTSGVKLWRAGRLRQAWNIRVDHDSFLTTDYYGANYVYSNGKLYKLYDDGTTKIILRNIVSASLERYTLAFFTIDGNGTLKFQYVSSEGLVESEIATNVVDADLSDDNLVLYVDKFGMLYMVNFTNTDSRILAMSDEEERTITCLGDYSIEEAKALYSAYWNCHKNSGWALDEFSEILFTAYQVRNGDYSALISE